MAEHRAGPLDRFLRLFTEVRAGEGRTALLLALNVFLILTAYYFVKPLREGLILGEVGPEARAYTAAAMATLLLPLVSGYGSLADRFPRRKLINTVTLIFVACLGVFFLLGTGGVPLGYAFYIWVGIFNVMIVAQFWAFANDVYTNEEGERLFPIVQVGASLGAVAGSYVVGKLIEPLGLFVPMLLAGGILLASLWITNVIDRRERRRTERGLPPDLSTAGSPAATGEFRLDTGEFRNLREALREALAEREAREAGEEDGGAAPREGTTGAGVAAHGRTASPGKLETERAGPGKDEGGFVATGAFRLVFRTRYLLYIGLLMLVLNWVNTNGENLLAFVVNDAAESAVAAGRAGGLSEGQYIGNFYSNFYLFVNVISLGMQLFLVSRIIKYLGIQVAILFLPLISLGAYGLIAFFPVLAWVRWAKTAENATDYSLQNTVRHTLFLPLTREQKYKAKQTIDSFFWRAGDVLAGTTVLLFSAILMIEAKNLAYLNLALVGFWIFLSVRIGRRYRELVESGRPPV